MSAPFQPIGERARWRVLVDLLREVPRGEVVTYARLGEALDLDPIADRKAIRAAVRQAAGALSVEHDRSLIAARNEGYRVALPDEHVELATGQQRRSSRALVRAKRHVDHVDLSGLSDDQRRVVQAAASVLAYQHQQIRKLDLRQRDLESALESVTTRVERSEAETEQQLSDLNRRIAELESPR